MPTAKQNHIRALFFRALAPFAIVAAASGAQASLVISTAATTNVTCSGGTCIATASNAALNATDLKSFLHRGDVRVDSGPANAIAVNAALNWTQGSRLTLAAGTGIVVSAPVVVAGHGAVTLTTGDKSASAVAFTANGRLDFWDRTSSFIVNGGNYTLVNDLPALVQAIAANPNGNFALAKNYDAKADAPYTASPIYVLYGSLDGLGHAISNLTIQSSESCAGLIAYLVDGTAPSVSNLTLAKLNLTQTWNGSFNNPRGTGGLTGCSQGTISHVRVTGQINGGEYAQAGGIAGWQAAGPSGTGPILDSFVNVVLSGGTTALLGGVVAYDYFGNIQRSTAKGRIEGTNAALAGGLAGLIQGSPLNAIAQNWSAMHVSANLAGGLVGETEGNLTLADNYASGAVSTGGGLIGKDTGVGGGSSGNQVQRSYALGHVRGGGVTGDDDGTGAYTNVYWDLDTSHVTNPARGVLNHPNTPGVTGLGDAQLKAALPAGFSASVWGLNAGINGGYPYLLANPPQ